MSIVFSVAKFIVVAFWALVCRVSALAAGMALRDVESMSEWDDN